MKLKKLISLGLASIMVTSALAGCGNTSTETQPQTSVKEETKTSESESKGTEEAPESTVEEEGFAFPLDEKITWSMATIMNNGEYKLSENPTWIEVCEEANVSFEYTMEVTTSEYGEKLNLLFVSDSYPDVLFKPVGGIVNYDDGILIPLEDMIREYMPNLTALLDERDAWVYMKEADGHIYSLPQDTLVGSVSSSWQLWYNQEWANRLGIKDPTSMEELYAMLKAFADEDANGNGDPDDEIPFTISSDGPGYKNFLMYFDDALHLVSGYQCIMDGEMRYYPLTTEFKDNLLTLLTNMYNDGILDPDSFTQSYSQQQAYGKSGDYLGMFLNGAPSSNVGDTYPSYHTVTPFNDHFPLGKGLTKQAMMITDKCEHPEVLLAFIDQFYAEEGARKAWMGREGVDYSINADGTAHRLYDEPDASVRFAGTTTTPAKRAALSLNYEVANPAEAHINYERYEKLLDYGVFVPTITFTVDEDTKIADITANLDPYVENYVARVVTGEIGLEDTWEDFQNDIEKMGAKELEEIYQAAYARSVAE